MSYSHSQRPSVVGEIPVVEGSQPLDWTCTNYKGMSVITQGLLTYITQVNSLLLKDW